MKLLSISCPSCGANLGESCRHGSRFVCEYCGGTTYVADFPMELMSPDEVDVDVIDDAFAREKSFSTPLCFIDGAVPDNRELNKQLDDIMALQKQFPTSDSIAAEIMRVFVGRKEVTTNSWQADDHKKVAGRVKLDPGENLLFYKCAALLPMNRLRAGMFLTDRRIGYLGLLGPESKRYCDVETFLVEMGSQSHIYWYPNCDEKVFISAFACSSHEMALLLTFALLKVAESTPDGTVVEIKIK